MTALMAAPRRTLAITLVLLGLAGGALAGAADARPSDDGNGCYHLSVGTYCNQP